MQNKHNKNFTRLNNKRAKQVFEQTIFSRSLSHFFRSFARYVSLFSAGLALFVISGCASNKQFIGDGGLTHYQQSFDHTKTKKQFQSALKTDTPDALIYYVLTHPNAAITKKMQKKLSKYEEDMANELDFAIGRKWPIADLLAKIYLQSHPISDYAIANQAMLYETSNNSDGYWLQKIPCPPVNSTGTSLETYDAYAEKWEHLKQYLLQYPNGYYATFVKGELARLFTSAVIQQEYGCFIGQTIDVSEDLVHDILVNWYQFSNLEYATKLNIADEIKAILADKVELDLDDIHGDGLIDQLEFKGFPWPKYDTRPRIENDVLTGNMGKKPVEEIVENESLSNDQFSETNRKDMFGEATEIIGDNTSGTPIYGELNEDEFSEKSANYGQTNRPTTDDWSNPLDDNTSTGEAESSANTDINSSTNEKTETAKLLEGLYGNEETVENSTGIDYDNSTANNTANNSNSGIEYDSNGNAISGLEFGDRADYNGSNNAESAISIPSDVADNSDNSNSNSNSNSKATKTTTPTRDREISVDDWVNKNYPNAGTETASKTSNSNKANSGSSIASSTNSAGKNGKETVDNKANNSTTTEDIASNKNSGSNSAKNNSTKGFDANGNGSTNSNGKNKVSIADNDAINALTGHQNKHSKHSIGGGFLSGFSLAWFLPIALGLLFLALLIAFRNTIFNSKTWS